MRIIHCADLHLDSKMETKLSTGQARERRYEILNTFEQMVQFGRENGVSVIIIAGDLFDSLQNQQKTIKNRVVECIRRYSEIDFIYLRGNHDYDGFLQALENIPFNLKLFTDQWISHKYDEVTITGIEFNESNSENYYDQLDLKEKDCNIVVLHGQTVPYRTSGKSHMIPLSELKEKYIDYMALGHVHQFTLHELDHRGVYCYSGCLEGRGFDECGEKGFVLLEITNKKMTTSFHTLGKRKLHEVVIDITGFNDFEEIVESIEIAIKQILIDDYVRILLVGELSENLELDLIYLEQMVQGKFYYGEVKNRTQLKLDEKKYENDISLKGEFIRKVRKKGLSLEEEQQVIQIGLRALAGKELF